MDAEKQYDLENRTMEFARRIRKFIAQLPKTIAVIEDARQLVRASGSIGANYIEAHEAISSKDELHRLKICRKEAKECRFWLGLICCGVEDGKTRDERAGLEREAFELTRIFGAIVHNKEGTRIITKEDISD